MLEWIVTVMFLLGVIGAGWAGYYVGLRHWRMALLLLAQAAVAISMFFYVLGVWG